MAFTEILNTWCGPQICHKFDTSQTTTLRGGGRPICAREIERLRAFLTPDSVFVDVGANIGSFTLALAPLCKKVIAFEAQRMFAYMLAGSVALNGHKNVWVHNFAVGRKLGFLAIPQYDMNKTLAWGSVEFGEKQREPIGQERLPDNPDDVVRIVALDELISLIGPKLDVLKIDVEGMEIDVLEGAKWSIMYHRPVMLIEHVKSSKIELLECLIKIEYNAEDIGMDFLCLPKERQ